MTIAEGLEQVKQLSLAEQQELIEQLKAAVEEKTPTKKTSLRDFKGLGAHAYDGQDAQEYINQTRDEWDTK